MTKTELEQVKKIIEETLNDGIAAKAVVMKLTNTITVKLNEKFSDLTG